MEIQLTEEEFNRIPKTADGKIIYPGMKVYVIEPFSEEKVTTATIYCVLTDGYCVLEENRYQTGEGYWEDGDYEYTSRVYADYESAMSRVKEIEQEAEEEIEDFINL